MWSPTRRDVLALILAAPATAQREERRSQIRSWGGTRVPGFAVGSVDGDRLEVFNVGAAGNGRPVDDETVFEAASLSKPVFAMGVLALHARGSLDLDRPISKIVDLRRETDDERVLRITPRHSLTHTTGLPNWRFTSEPLRCAFVPGERFSYSGEGIFLLQRLVEHITGTGLAASMARDVLGPLAMHASSFAYQHRFKNRLAVPHDAFGKPSEHRTFRIGEQLLAMASAQGRPLEQWTWPEMRAALPELVPPQLPLPVFSTINAASSLLTTARDYARVVRAFPKHATLTKAQVAVAPGIAWGLGVGLETGEHPFAFGWGDNDGFKALLEADARIARGTVVLTNGDAGIPLAIRVARSIVGPNHRSFAWITAMYS